MNNSKPLYSDGLVELTDEAILFRHYYFPIGGSRSIPIVDIKQIEQRPPTLSNGKWRLWGTSNFRQWFPVDWRRPKRDAIFFLIRSGRKKKIGFTVEDNEEFVEAVKNSGIDFMKE